MGSEFRKVISKCVNEAKVGRKNTAPVVSKAYIESLDKDDISLTTMSLLNKKKPGKMSIYVEGWSNQHKRSINIRIVKYKIKL